MLKPSGKFFGENTLQNRRKLRSDIEKRSLAINKNFLAAFREVKQSLDGIRGEIIAMDRSVDTMKERLSSTQRETRTLILQTNGLQAECAKLEFQQTIAKAFMARFQLTADEQKCLYGSSSTNARDIEITPDFFAALDRIHAIHNECRTLMQSGHQTAASDIMEEMTLHQEAALERLYRWTQNHCRNLDASTEIGKLTMEAMSRLQDRPVLFKYVLDEFGTVRRAVLVRNFIDALTRGPKPIESLASSDPKRYVGDMFAWLHQAISLERENLLMLVKRCDRCDCTEVTQETLSQICDGVCHPLKVRVENVLHGNGSSSEAGEKQAFVLYAVANLIRFYERVLNETVKGGGQLAECLQDLQVAGEQAYLTALGNEVRALLTGPGGMVGLEPPTSELLPSKNVTALLMLLKEILGVANMTADGRRMDIAKIVAVVLDPALQSVTEVASHLPTVDMAVYLLNGLNQMHTTLAMYEYMEERLERLQAQCEAQFDTLTSAQASSLVNHLNLGPIYAHLQNKAVKIEEATLSQFVERFDAFLETPEVLLLPQVQLIQSVNHQNIIRQRSFQVIVTIYKQLVEKVGADSPLLRHTPEQVAKLLQ